MNVPLPTLVQPVPVLPEASAARKGRSSASSRYFVRTATGRLLGALAIFLAVLAGYNLLIYRNVQKSQRRQLLALVDRLPARTDCLFLGNSLVAAGCDTAAFASAWPGPQECPKSANLALGGTSPVEHYLILKRALSQPLHPKFIIYGFFDDQLNSRPRGHWSDLVG